VVVDVASAHARDEVGEIVWRRLPPHLGDARVGLREVRADVEVRVVEHFHGALRRFARRDRLLELERVDVEIHAARARVRLRIEGVERVGAVHHRNDVIEQPRRVGGADQKPAALFVLGVCAARLVEDSIEQMTSNDERASYPRMLRLVTHEGHQT
jgi:hypothetical protein